MGSYSLEPLGAIDLARLCVEVRRVGDAAFTRFVTTADPSRTATEVHEGLEALQVRARLMFWGDLLIPERTALDEVAICELPSLSAGELVRWEMARTSILDRFPRLLLVSSEDAIRHLARAAPNFFAVGLASLRPIDSGELSDLEREAILEGFRRRHEMSDAELLRLAEAGAADLDPERRVWLVLLGREDLLQTNDTAHDDE
jgi:hypothetical protein